MDLFKEEHDIMVKTSFPMDFLTGYVKLGRVLGEVNRESFD